MDSGSFKFNPDATDFIPTNYNELEDKMSKVSLNNQPSNWDDEVIDEPLESDKFINKEKIESKDEKKQDVDNRRNAPPDPDPRAHLNIVFIGHIDAGKSTTCGNILYQTGYVDERTIEKYEKEAIDKGRDSWFLAFIMDTNEEERSKGKTVEVGRASIETPNRRFTILDAPGHRSFVPNMIGGATQADCAVLIISARKGEFETGFERGGQTREHALLAKTLGVSQLIVAINKMDEPSCNWSEERYNSIIVKLKPYLKKCGYNEKDVNYIPISGLTGQNLINHVSDKNYKHYNPNASWYGLDKPSLMTLLDTVPPPDRSDTAPLRIPLIDGYKDNGVMCLGKVELGTVRAGQQCIIMPDMVVAKVANVYFEEDEFAFAKPGENIRLRLLGVEEDQVNKGCVICDINDYCQVSCQFVAQLAIIELHLHRPIITAGYLCILHVHTIFEEVEFVTLLESIDRKTKKKQDNPAFVKQDLMVKAILKLQNPICLETFDKCGPMARITLRDEGKTVAIGKITEIIN